MSTWSDSSASVGHKVSSSEVAQPTYANGSLGNRKRLEDEQAVYIEDNHFSPNCSDTLASDITTGKEFLPPESTDSKGLEAFRRDRPAVEPDGETSLVHEAKQEPGTPSGGSWRSLKPRRILLVAPLLLAIGALAPFAWNYLQSYESTDDAQIDGHIDPLSSRIDGTVVAVHAEDDDRVAKGELLVEIDPRDYEVAVEQAKARFELALAQVASAKQDYDAALANVREADATNYKAQRDAQRYAILLEKQVVPQEQYDQYTAIALVDAAK